METEIIFKPIPNTSQCLALDTRCDETLYTGERGPGKTITQLMLFRRFVGIGYGRYWRGIIFDREYKNLDDMISKSKQFFYKFDDGARFLSSKGDYKWVWPTGEELLFRAIKKANEYWNYHGQEFPFIGWNELTKYPTSELYDMMQSCNRSSFTPEKDNIKMPSIPLKTFSTCNPWGAGHNWVKRQWIEPVPYGKVAKTEVEVFNPKTKKQEIVTKKRVAIFGSYKENIYLDVQYVATLESIQDPAMKEAWLHGNWDIESGGALDGAWNRKIHVIPRFVVPQSWRIDRSFDWGRSHPFSVGWWAEANGEECKLLDGTIFCPKAGSLIQIAEWYGTKEIGTNKGLKMSSPDVARGIMEKEMELLSNGWIRSQPLAGPADNSIGDTIETDVETIAVKMSKEGIRWLSSDKTNGSRKRGLQVICDRLKAASDGEGPGLYFMNNCKASITIIPTLPRDPDDPDDVDTDSEDHCYDMVRYRCTKGNNRDAKTLDIKQIF